MKEAYYVFLLRGLITGYHVYVKELNITVMETGKARARHVGQSVILVYGREH